MNVGVPRDLYYTNILDNKLIENIKTYKLLGVYLDHTLNYNMHISKVIGNFLNLVKLFKSRK